MKLFRVSKATSQGLKLLAKFALTLLALYIVIQQIDLSRSISLLYSVSVWPVLLAFLFYNASQVLSSIRLNTFFRAEGIHISTLQNLRLYYQGMFYNLFLPGGIGGDGYKILIIGKVLANSTTKAFRAILGDRINGAIALGVLACLLGVPAIRLERYVALQYLMIALSLLAVPVSGMLVKRYFKRLRNPWFPGLGHSFLVQIFQAIMALLVFQALHVATEASFTYVALFFVSSLVSAVPFTIGGIGARELTFIWASTYVAIDAEKSVAFTLLFFIINATSSIIGGFIPDPTRLQPTSQVSKP